MKVNSYFIKKKKFSGYLEEINSNKIKISRTGYLNGRKEGIEKIWHANNKISEIRFYKQGKKVGIHELFWDNGNKKMIAIEGSGGTQKLLKKSKNKKFKNNGVLVKFPKKKQDLRIDLPTVGLKTLRQCKFAGLKGIVVKNNQNIFLDKKKCINFANKNKMFILSK